MGELVDRGLAAWHHVLRQRDPEAMSAALDEVLYEINLVEDARRVDGS